MAKALARADRGDFPRPLRVWRELFSAFFEPVACFPYPLGVLGVTLWNMVYFKGRPKRSAPRVTVAVPVYNEEANVVELVRRTAAVLDQLPGGPHQLLFVDDGSSDRTRALLEDAAAADRRVTVVALSRNFGHQPALTAALDHVGGDVVILMDGDLQDSPEAIPRFLEAHARGYDVVYAQRVGHKEAWWLRLCYFVFYRLLGAMSRLKLPVDAGDFCLMSRRAVDELRRASDFHRYLRGLRAWVGFRQLALPIERAPRHRGQPKYSWLTLVSLALDGVFSYSVLPLRLATVTGAPSCLALGRIRSVRHLRRPRSRPLAARIHGTAPDHRVPLRR